MAETGRRRARARLLDRRRSRTLAVCCDRCATALEAGLPFDAPPGARAEVRASSPRSSNGAAQATGRYVQALHVLGELKDTIACDISRARKELGTSPRVGLFEGMRASIRWCSRGATGSDAALVLITGGSGYFGSVLAEQAPAGATGPDLRPEPCRGPSPTRSRVRPGDVRDRRPCAVRVRASTSCSTTSPRCRWPRTGGCSTAVNVGGDRERLGRGPRRRVGKVSPHLVEREIRHSRAQPGYRGTPLPAARGLRAGQAPAELLCHDAIAAGLDVTIIRPRTVLGHGRLGVMALLFEFVADGCAGVRPRRRSQPLSARARDRPRRRVPAAAGARRTVRLQRRRPRLRHDARDAPRSSTTRRPVRTCARCPSRARALRHADARVARAWRRSRRHWLLYSDPVLRHHHRRADSAGSREHSTRRW